MSNEREDGGYAFPVPLAINEAGDVMHAAQWSSGGMTLRDYFAAQALAGILAFPGAVVGNRDKSGAVCARAAYVYADAMLAERSK